MKIKTSASKTFLICSLLIIFGKQDASGPLELGAQVPSKQKIDVAREIDRLIKSNSQGVIEYLPGYLYSELIKQKAANKNNFKVESSLDWKERGPTNVGGRTRHLLVDAADNSNRTWLAGTAGGGIWKTSNAGTTWTNVSPNAPNLAVCTIAQSPSAPLILYAGTGESALGGTNGNGSGILKSTDGGNSWSLLPATSITNSNNFWNVNEIIVDPSDANHLFAATSNGGYGQSFQSAIMKSVNGGDSWAKVYQPRSWAQQIIADPDNFDILYASIYFNGVVKSTDGGATWTNTVLSTVAGSYNPERTELAIAPTDPNILYASVSFANRSGAGLFVSQDKGENWSKVENFSTSSQIDFLQQGEYDNCITVHPNDASEVFLGGVSLWRASVDFQETKEGSKQFLRVDEGQTAAFLSFVNFGSGTHYGNRLAITDDSATPNIEIRFGPGKNQMAHRFTVPEGATSGVVANDYSYQNYVEVPFEVWDTDQNRQLMVSFRDQERDGAFNLNEAANDQVEANNREYLYFHNMDYAATPAAAIMTNGGHEVDNLIFSWPTLTPGSVWNPNAIAQSTFSILFGNIHFINASFTTISDFNAVHSDHHYLTTISHPDQTFRLFTCNDGGVAYSDNEGSSYTTVEDGFNTTQFYAASKKPGFTEYMGGTQDNEVLRSRAFSSADPVAFNRQAPPNQVADGFEAVYAGNNPNKLLASNQNNVIFRSVDAGKTWTNVHEDINDSGFGNANAPFYTKIGYSVNGPAMAFAISQSGVWKSEDFGLNWRLIRITDNWSGFYDIEVSDADPNYIWAGGGMGDISNIYLSTDRGETFLPVQNFDIPDGMGNITTLVPDPLDKNGCFAVFSQANNPKILRTQDKGATWEDLSGFNLSDDSNNGFPDVATFTVLAFPDGQTIWAGTEIGLVESTDNGKTWQFADNGLPSVMIWDLKLTDGEVVVATHGRGIWTVDVNQFYENQLVLSTSEPRVEFSAYPNPATDRITVKGAFDNSTTISLIDIQGKTLLKQQVLDGSKHIHLDVKQFPKGNYILSVRSKKGEQKRKVVLH